MGHRSKQKAHERRPSWRERWKSHEGDYPYQHQMGGVPPTERKLWRYRVWTQVLHELAHWDDDAAEMARLGRLENGWMTSST
jgi:hypothetical protein